MERLEGFYRDRKAKKHYGVMTDDGFYAETWAVSAEKAINNVRYNYFISQENYDYGMDDFDAVELDGTGQPLTPPPPLNWYVLEFSVMDGYDPYFSRYDAQYKVLQAPSEEKAKRVIDRRYFNYGDGSEGSFQKAYFGKVQEFETEGDAKKCAKEWYQANKDDIEQNTSEEARQWLRDFANSFSLNSKGGN